MGFLKKHLKFRAGGKAPFRISKWRVYKAQTWGATECTSHDVTGLGPGSCCVESKWWWFSGQEQAFAITLGREERTQLRMQRSAGQVLRRMPPPHPGPVFWVPGSRNASHLPALKWHRNTPGVVPWGCSGCHLEYLQNLCLTTSCYTVCLNGWLILSL